MNIKQIEQAIKIKDLEIDRVRSRMKFLSENSLELRMEIDSYCDEHNKSPHTLMDRYYEVASELGMQRHEEERLVRRRDRYRNLLNHKMTKKSFFRRK